MEGWFLMSLGHDAHAETHIAAFRTVLASNLAAIQVLDNKLAELIAATYTNEELAAYVAFFETPAGRSIMEKRQTSNLSLLTGAFHPPEYTQDERDALAQWNASPVAKSFAAKTIGLVVQEATLISPLEAKMLEEYCKEVEDCPARNSDR